MWIVDLSRSLDPGWCQVLAPAADGMFDAAGWQVITVKHGTLLVQCLLSRAELRSAPSFMLCPIPGTSSCDAAGLRAGHPAAVAMQAVQAHN